MASVGVCLMLQRRLCTSAAAKRVSAAEVRSWRSTLFTKEQERQRSLYPRIEKIEVTMHGAGLQGTLLVMNKGLSTPFTCARHLTDWHISNAALALVDGEPWHLHRSLTRSCSLTLLTFKDADPQLANQAYWRSCAALLSQVLDSAFKDDYSVELLKIPEVPGTVLPVQLTADQCTKQGPSRQAIMTTGAFCCDLVLDPQLDSWTATEESLRSFTRDALQLICQNLPWEPLEVTPHVALEIFSHSRYKQEEVEEKAAQSPNGTVSLYRCGHHVVLAGGPLVARTGLCSQYEVTALHTLGEGPLGLQRRAQGLSLPFNLTAHHTVWMRLRKRAEKLVEIQSSSVSETETVPASSQPSSQL